MTAQTLGSVSRNRQDILPYYARLVGTLNPFMPDVGKELVALVRRPATLAVETLSLTSMNAQLEDEFRYFQRKKQADLAESRSKVRD